MQTISRSLACLMAFVIAIISVSAETITDNPLPTPGVSAPKPTADLAKQVQEITTAVLDHHLDPPARQQMILSGIKALYRVAGVPLPPGLSGRVSSVATPEQLNVLLTDVWPKTTAKPASLKVLEETLFQGLLAPVPGDAELMTAKDRKVTEQLEGNRYVGIHISLGMNDERKQPILMQVLEGGPAERAGLKAGDLIEEIDGVATKGVALRDVVDRLRGEEGTSVTIKVRQLKETTSRTMTITRGRLPRATIQGVRKRPNGDWDLRFDGLADPIGYLKINDIEASTPHELRKLAQQLESQGVRALILDLRGANRTNPVHPAVLLADSLLDHGTIGRVRTVQGETTYQADSDALFRGWPIAVLVDATTSGSAEWLAAALQDNHRATIIGAPTRGALRGRASLGHLIPTEPIGVRSRVSIGDGSWSIELTTGELERGNGQPLALAEHDATEPSQEIPLQPEKSQSIKTGVKPDHLVPAKAASLNWNRARGPVSPPSPTVQPKTPEPISTSEPAIEQALKLLRISLKTN